MANHDSFYDLLLKSFRDMLRNVDTIKPGVVTARRGNLINARILTTTRYASGKVEEQSEVFNVPLFTYSAKRGDAAITVPVSVGDNIVVVFSDRDLPNLSESGGTSPLQSTEVETHRYAPLLAFPSPIIPNEVEIPENEVRIEYGSSMISITEDSIDIVSPNITLNGVNWNHGHAYTDDGTPMVTGPQQPLS